MKDKGSEAWLKKKLKRLSMLEPYTFPELWNGRLEHSEQSIKLDANENYFIPRELISRILQEVASEVDLRVYPLAEHRQLTETLSEKLKIPPEQIVLGSGSSQLIDALIYSLAKPRGRVVSLKPSFSLYRMRSKVHGAKFVEVPLNDDLSMDCERLLKVSRGSDIIFICSPNNPTGNQFSQESVLEVVESFPGLVVLDEAYVDFADFSLITKALEYRNLVVLRSFSKGCGLAGGRLGYLVGNAELAGLLRSRVLRPYSVSSVTLKVAQKLLENHEVLLPYVQRLKEERDRLQQTLNGIGGIKAFPSKTNFIFVNVFHDDGSLGDRLMSRGVYIRKVGKVFAEGCAYRITVGLPGMNSRLVEELKALI
ncbi:MAG: histidinol-phosphate transaminase [Candidatus Terraquivivens tikiterensis]|uniref:Histidinol-phosphate transaminase n=1 Tax=Candidatus Terraquivivens tikiterensis TaxID=1980982 RepID=A0A2R7Y1X2_9ARCH|nr:MAG: histidinol-phosphate transaminase [Candidatus Terraquivivens tikiterensis]